MKHSYEVIIILPEALSDDRIDKALKAFSKEVKALKGACSSPSRLGRKTFARPQQKHVAGEFALLNVELLPEAVSKLRDRIRLNEDLFRVNIIRKDTKKAVAE